MAAPVLRGSDEAVAEGGAILQLGPLEVGL